VLCKNQRVQTLHKKKRGNMPKKGFIPNKLKPWIEARERFHLTHAQIQMARELGLNPKKFGSIANNNQEMWKLSLPEYIEHLYLKRFNKLQPDDIRPVEVKDAEKRKRKLQSKIKPRNVEEINT